VLIFVVGIITQGVVLRTQGSVVPVVELVGQGVLVVVGTHGLAMTPSAGIGSVFVAAEILAEADSRFCGCTTGCAGTGAARLTEPGAGKIFLMG
jgi:hypothetical protein